MSKRDFTVHFCESRKLHFAWEKAIGFAKERDAELKVKIEEKLKKHNAL